MRRLALPLLCCASGLPAAGALRAREREQRASPAADEEGKTFVGAECLAPEDRPRISELEAAYGGAQSFWTVDRGLFAHSASEASRIVKENKDEWPVELQVRDLRRDEESSKSVIYGEMRPEGVLTLLRRLGSRPGLRYYDLGSGSGKTVLLAAHFFGMNATGVELVASRHESGCRAVDVARRGWASASSRAQAGGAAQLVHGSFFDYDFSDADIIFMSNGEWSDEMMERIKAMSMGLKPGARIAMWKFPMQSTPYAWPDDWKTVVDELELPSTWGEPFAWTIIEKVSASRPAASLPPASAAREQCSASPPVQRL